MTCPLTNQGRMLNFIESLSKENKLHIFSIADGNDKQITNNNIFYYDYEVKSGFRNKLIKHTFFWKLHRDLFKIVNNKIKESDIHLIICHDLPTLNPAIELKKQYDSKLLYDSLEIYTETINQFFPSVSGLKKIIAKLLVKFMRFFGARREKIMMKSCDKISTVNESLAKYFEKKYSQNDIQVIMNCPKYIESTSSSIDFRKKFKISPNSKIFIYQGTFNEGRGLELLLKSFYKVVQANENIKLILLGSGVLKNQLIQTVHNLDLTDTIFFHDPVPYANLIEHTIGADFGINLLEPFNLSKKFASPNKLFEYMQAEIPVLCSYSPENDLIFQNYSIGEQCDIDTESIKDAILKLSQKSVAEIELHKKMSQKAKSKYCWENQEELLIQNIEYLTMNEK